MGHNIVIAMYIKDNWFFYKCLVPSLNVGYNIIIGDLVYRQTGSNYAIMNVITRMRTILFAQFNCKINRHVHSHN